MRVNARIERLTREALGKDAAAQLLDSLKETAMNAQVRQQMLREALAEPEARKVIVGITALRVGALLFLAACIVGAAFVERDEVPDAEWMTHRFINVAPESAPGTTQGNVQDMTY